MERLNYGTMPPGLATRLFDPARYPITFALTVLSVGMVVMMTIRHNSDWTDTYLPSARLLSHGGDIYRDHKGNTYPPFCAWIFVPFTLPEIHIARAVWVSLIALSLVVLLDSAWRLAGGGPLEPLDRARPADFWAYALGHVCVFQFALGVLNILQPDLTIAALVTLGSIAIAQRRFLRAALWIGLGAAFKATPLLFAPYLLWRRQWAAATLLVAVAVGLNLLPNMFPPPHGGTWLGEWYNLYLRPMTRANYRPGDWKNLLNNNQSLAGAAQRWTQSKWTDNPDSTRIANDASGRVKNLFRLLVALVLIPLPLCLWQRWRATGSLYPQDPLSGAAECGVVILLMLLFSPNSSRAHFCLMYLPAFLTARTALTRGGIAMPVLIFLAALTSTLSIHIRIPATHTVEQILMWLGMVMWSAIFLLAAQYLMIARSPGSVMRSEQL